MSENRRVKNTSLWINAVCTQHSERLVIFMYTKTNLLLTKTVVLVVAVGVYYGRAPLAKNSIEYYRKTVVIL